MRLAVALLFILTLAAPAGAQQDAKPVLEFTFDEAQAIPGQMLSLRMTVLVPTYMPKPPVWPALEMPNVLVRLPERSTNPTSRQVGDETWAGVTRIYRISPMVPGRFAIPPQEIVVTYADPETNKPVSAHLTTQPLSFSGITPEGTEGLNPFIAADALDLTQEIDGDPETMKPGSSVTRTVTATVRGVSPMFLPKLLPATAIEGLAAYPDEPVVIEKETRDEIGGTRTERVTLMAESGGSGEAPPVSLGWYNLRTKQVETASLDGFAVSVDAPPARRGEPLDWRAIGIIGFGAVFVFAVLAWILRIAVPPLVRAVRDRYAEWLASERWAYSVLRGVVAGRRFADLYPALDDWAQKVPGPDPRRHPALKDALVWLGAARYGAKEVGNTASAWKAIAAALPDARRASRKVASRASALPALNPDAELMGGE